VTSTTFVLSWPAVTNSQSYVLWINGSVFNTYTGTGLTTTGTVTPGTSGPWTLNLYAYGTGGGLLASGQSIANLFIYTNATVMPLPSSGTTGASALTLSNYSNTISGITGTLSFMNGNYTVSSSSTGAGTFPYRMFDSDGNAGSFWITNYGGNSYGQDPYSSYVYRGGINPYVYVTSVVSGAVIAGEWLQLQFPYSFLLTGHSWLGRSNYFLWIGKDYTIAGSNDGTTWTQVARIITGSVSTTNGNGTYIEPITATNYYSYYRLICTSGNDGGNWYGKKWILYGSK
jgi:hypothetical protein